MINLSQVAYCIGSTTTQLSTLGREDILGTYQGFALRLWVSNVEDWSLDRCERQIGITKDILA
jgi:hypothetical protein